MVQGGARGVCEAGAEPMFFRNPVGPRGLPRKSPLCLRGHDKVWERLISPMFGYPVDRLPSGARSGMLQIPNGCDGKDLPAAAATAPDIVCTHVPTMPYGCFMCATSFQA